MSEKGKQAGSSEEICHRCGQPKKSSREGTFTRWMVACTCDLASEEESVVPVETAHFCATCGKRIGIGRQGSFTQWIFRSDICSCETPVVFQRAVPIESEASAGTRPAGDFNVEPEILPDPEVAEYAEAICSIAGERYRPILLLGAGATGTVDSRCFSRAEEVADEKSYAHHRIGVFYTGACSACLSRDVPGGQPNKDSGEKGSE